MAEARTHFSEFERPVSRGWSAFAFVFLTQKAKHEMPFIANRSRWPRLPLHFKKERPTGSFFAENVSF